MKSCKGSKPQNNTIFTILKLAIFTIGIIKGKSITEAICRDLKNEHDPLLSDPVYEELTSNLDWDLGQDTLRGELSRENQKLMRCLFIGGFSYANIEHCLGDNYDHVIEGYHAKVEETRLKFEESILEALKSQGFDIMAPDAFQTLAAELDEALANSENPEMALNNFQLSIKDRIPADHANIEDLKQRMHGHYLVYLSFKRLIKAFIFMTISCVQSFIEKVELSVPREFNYKLFSEDKIEKMFPEDEINKMYTKKVTVQNDKLDKMNILSTSTFNQDMAKQGNYSNLIAMNIATARIDDDDIDINKTPEENFKSVVLQGKSRVQHTLV